MPTGSTGGFFYVPAKPFLQPAPINCLIECAPAGAAAGSHPELAYRLMFAVLAVALLIALTVYAGVRNTRPIRQIRMRREGFCARDRQRRHARRARRHHWRYLRRHPRRDLGRRAQGAHGGVAGYVSSDLDRFSVFI